MTTKRANRDNTTMYSSNDDIYKYIYIYIYIHTYTINVYHIHYVYIYISIYTESSQTRQTRTRKKRSYEQLQSSPAKWRGGSLAPPDPRIMWVCLRIHWLITMFPYFSRDLAMVFNVFRLTYFILLLIWFEWFQRCWTYWDVVSRGLTASSRCNSYREVHVEHPAWLSM